MQTVKRKLSVISSMHYFRLCYRGLLFLWALITWFCSPELHKMTFSQGIGRFKWLFIVIWFVFAFEMLMRFFPSPTESMGCQKQFRKNYIPQGQGCPDCKSMNHGVGMVIVSWIVLNGIFWVLYLTGVFPTGVMVLIALFYAISDMICILFFCPFQTLMMKNRCCGTCRIYNWDYLMMFTPLIVIPSFYTWSLVALALGLFLRWEFIAHRHPERFSEETNAALRCANCTEKLCHHKKQLRVFWKSEEARIQRAADRIRNKL